MNQFELAEKAIWLEILDAMPDHELSKIMGVWDRKALAIILTKKYVGFYGDYITAIVLKKMGVKEVIPGKMWMKCK